MAKRTRKDTPKETARRKLIDAQAKLQLAQDKRSRTVAQGEQEIEAVRERASARTERATQVVERRAAKVSRAEAKLSKLRETRPTSPCNSRATATQTPPVESQRQPEPVKMEEPETALPVAVVDDPPAPPLAAPPAPKPKPTAAKRVTAASADETTALAGAEARALETLRTEFADQGATFTAWLAASGVSRKTFLSARKALVDRGLVQRAGTGPGALYSPTA